MKKIGHFLLLDFWSKVRNKKIHPRSRFFAQERFWILFSRSKVLSPESLQHWQPLTTNALNWLGFELTMTSWWRLAWSPRCCGGRSPRCASRAPPSSSRSRWRHGSGRDSSGSRCRPSRCRRSASLTSCRPSERRDAGCWRRRRRDRFWRSSSTSSSPSGSPPPWRWPACCATSTGLRSAGTGHFLKTSKWSSSPFRGGTPGRLESAWMTWRWWWSRWARAACRRGRWLLGLDWLFDNFRTLLDWRCRWCTSPHPRPGCLSGKADRWYLPEKNQIYCSAVLKLSNINVWVVNTNVFKASTHLHYSQSKQT